MTKIAVYTIAKNEAQHIERWYESASKADAVFVVDTGSTDNSPELFRALDIEYFEAGFQPFRFDAARNFILNQIPDAYDWCVFLDLDEVLEDGWIDKLKYAIDLYPRTRGFNFNMVFEQGPDGKPITVYSRHMAHRNKQYKWMYPVHELLTAITPSDHPELDLAINVYHLPDTSKPRSEYLHLLELGVRENPEDPRCSQYLGREYMYRGEYRKAISELQRHLTLERFPVAKSESCRFIADCNYELNQLEEAERWHLRGLSECPSHREPWGYISMFYFNCGEFESCIGTLRGMFRVESIPTNVTICRKDYYEEWPYHLAAVCYHNLGNKEKAIDNIVMAYDMSPVNPRVLSDYATITNKLPPNIKVLGKDYAENKDTAER